MALPIHVYMVVGGCQCASASVVSVISVSQPLLGAHGNGPSNSRRSAVPAAAHARPQSRSDSPIINKSLNRWFGPGPSIDRSIESSNPIDHQVVRGAVRGEGSAFGSLSSDFKRNRPTARPYRTQHQFPKAALRSAPPYVPRPEPVDPTRSNGTIIVASIESWHHDSSRSLPTIF